MSALICFEDVDRSPVMQQAGNMNTTPNNKIAILGKLVTYIVSATVVEISGGVRKKLRPDDIELKGEQLSYGEETIILGSPGADPQFAEQLLNSEVGTVKSFEYQYLDYDKDNLVSPAGGFSC